jgi:outer membrane receptor protein involved in Fe transport
LPALLPAQPAAIEPLKTSITVVEKVSAETPASISFIDGAEIRRAPGVNLDDRLRTIPGFSLFRRSSSVVAHPTTQGVSLRGIGPTGASRTLVLWEGIPLNDPFGGWVYWNRLAPDEIERVEVSRGASTSLFGDRAMGGVVALFSREPQPLHFHSGYEGGSHGSHEGQAGFSHLWQRWAVSAGGRAFHTNGYFIVPGERRGAIDERAALEFAAGNARLDYLRDADRLFLKFDVLSESRRNGTALQRNSTGLGNIAAHYARERGRNGLSVLAYHTREEFRSTFSAIAADRNSERLTVRQSVPSESVGGAALWEHRGAVHILAGADALRAEGWSRETLYPVGRRTGGGRQSQHGVFAQSDFGAGPARFFLGARQDSAGRAGRFLSPSGGFAVGRNRLRARGSLYRSFRAPTLNELFREFRVGNDVTRANAELEPERVFGAELGLDVVAESTRVSFTAYRNSLTDLITNVTLSREPNLTIRQRQNAESAVARGAELEARRRWGALEGRVAYLFVDSRFGSRFRVPQVPRHQGSAQLDYARPDTLVTIAVRSYAAQFEDDRNQTRELLLPGFASVQFLARRRLTGGLSATLAVENLLDRQYLVGLTPAPVIGPPRLWRAGLRWEGRLR